MEETGLAYEAAEYKRMVIRDVNNYSAQFMNGAIKHKGAFEIDKELHKDPSMRIVPIALEKYFFENKPIEETIRNHRDIYDFCLRLKTNKKSVPYFFWLDLKENKIYNKRLQRTTRYFMSKRGGQLRKHFISGSETILDKDYLVTLFNDYYPVDDWKDYNINYNYYEKEARKIINIIEYSEINPTLF